MIHVNPLHSRDFTPLVSYLSAVISRFTGVSRCSSKDGEIKGWVFLRSSGRLGREIVGSKQLFWTLGRSRPSSNVTPADTILFTKWACLHEICHEKMGAHLY